MLLLLEVLVVAEGVVDLQVPLAVQHQVVLEIHRLPLLAKAIVEVLDNIHLAQASAVAVEVEQVRPVQMPVDTPVELVAQVPPAQLLELLPTTLVAVVVVEAMLLLVAAAVVVVIRAIMQMVLQVAPIPAVAVAVADIRVVLVVQAVAEW
jgi:hypothetical protein